MQFFLEGKQKISPVPPKEVMGDVGLTYFSYGLISKGKVLYSYFSHKEWGELYQKKHYDEVDPLLQSVVHFHFPLIVWDALHPCGQEKKIMTERNEICQLNSGLSIGLTNKKYTELIAFGSEMSPQAFHDLLKNKNYTRKIYQIVSQFYKAVSQDT